MNQIYVLKSKKIDVNFGEHSDQWIVAGWTDELRVAREWRDGSTRDENRDFERVAKVPANNK